MPRQKKGSASTKKKAAARPPGSKSNRDATRHKLYLECPETDERVWITQATLQDIKSATKKKRQPFARNRKYLVKVTSPTVRQTVYDRHADALRELEERVLPEYGGRPWKVQVTITDPPKQYPFFVFRPKGHLEIAAWPHIIERMPDPPRFPGYSQGGESNNKKKRDQSNRDNSNSSSSTKRKAEQPKNSGEETCCAEEEGGKADASEEEKSSSDAGGSSSVEGDESEHDEEESESEASECESEDEEEQLSAEILALHELQDREASPLSRLAYSERWRQPMPNISIKWISPIRQIFSTRKSAWENAVKLCRNEVYLDKHMHGLGASGQPIKVFYPSKPAQLKAGAIRFERDGVWVVGQDERWQNERLRAEAEEIEEEEEEEEGKEEEQRASKVASNSTRSLTPLAYYLQCNKKPHRTKRLTELQQDADATTSSSLNNRRAVVEDAVAVGVMASPEETPKDGNNDNLSDNGAKKVTANDSVAIAEGTQAAAMAPTAVEKNRAEEEKKEEEVVRKDSKEAAQTPKNPPTNTPVVVRFTLRDAERELRNIWKKLSEDERAEWAEQCSKYQKEQKNARDVGSKPSASEQQTVSPTTETSTNATKNDSNNSWKETSVSPTNVMGIDAGTGSDPSPPTVDSEKEAAANTPQRMEQQKAVAVKKPAPKSTPATLKTWPKSTHWRLNAQQIQLCYDAGIEHYDQVMRTVKARGLTRELQDGFNLLRERGAGRYDMELPVFDKPKFRFLTDMKKSPWMPVVRAILGNDVVLIHKGMFLSMPGSAKQVYHQDGIHLTQQYQKPCHAINVFIPLIDMTLDHGPTEFCLGSHILGQENFQEEFLYTPTVSAGTPVIFDYRVGHRGLANNSPECRPIVYCSYARVSDAGNAAFRDSINFSKKRYHQLGDLVEKGLTREERARKRELANEEYWPEESTAANNNANGERTPAAASHSSEQNNNNSKPRATKKPRK